MNYVVKPHTPFSLAQWSLKLEAEMLLLFYHILSNYIHGTFVELHLQAYKMN